MPTSPTPQEVSTQLGTSASNSLWWVAGLKWWEFLWKYLMWNDGLDSLFVFTIERIKNEEGKASNLRATRMDIVAAKGFGTSASSFPGLLQAVLPCGDHGIVSYSITKHSKDAKQTFPRQPNLAIADLIYSFLFWIFGIFHQLCAKRKDGSFFIVMISCMFFNWAPSRSIGRLSWVFLPWKFVWDSRSLAGKFPHLSGHSRHTRLRPMQCRSLWFGSSMDSGIEE